MGSSAGSGAQGPEGLIGQTVAGYRLEDLLGVGLTGAVYLGKWQGDAPAMVEKTASLPVEQPLEAAIKLLILPLQKADERAEFRRRFDREAATLKGLRHPNIVALLASGTDEASGYTYMVLRYLSGGTLAEYIAGHEGPIPLDEVSSILTQIAAALGEAHTHDVVHRDIKPANILLDEQHRPYLSDFSIARLLDETASKLTMSGRVMGTWAYMSPEQVTGEKVGPATDIYSLGMVVYELVTGKTAFDGTSMAALLNQQVHEEPPPPRTLRPDLPEPAEAAILRALAKDPAERFDSPQAFAEAFADGLRNQWSSGLTSFTPSERQRLADTHADPQPTPAAAPPWGAAQPAGRGAHGVRPPGGRFAPLIAGALALLLVSCFALGAVTRFGLGNVFGASHGSTVVHLGSRTPSSSASARSGGATATSHTSQNPGGAAPTDTPRPGYTGPGAPPTATFNPTPTFTPSPTPTFTPSPTPTFTPTPTNTPVRQSIQIGWSGRYPTWIWMTFNNFPTGTYRYYCNFSTPPQSNGFYITETSEPQTWDDGKTCYDQQAGDHVWVTVNGVSSNTLTVP